MFAHVFRMLERDKHELDMQKRYKEIEEEKALYSVSILCQLRTHHRIKTENGEFLYWPWGLKFCTLEKTPIEQQTVPKNTACFLCVIRSLSSPLSSAYTRLRVLGIFCFKKIDK